MNMLAYLIHLARDAPQGTPQSVATKRVLFAQFLAVLCFVFIGYRVVEVPLTADDTKRTYAAHAQQVPRGDILDRNGQIMATTLQALELYANPKEILDPIEATAALAEVLTDLDEAQIFARLTRKSRYAELAWRLSPQKYNDVLQLGIAGVYGRSKLVRVYPNIEAAAHLLGGVNKDDKGIAGIELSMDERLTAGEDVMLALDLNIQAVLRQEISNQIERFQAIGGAGLVQDITTGEILAMVSLPDFDANHLRKASENQRFNRATSGVYELGSTFKIFNTAIALESGVFRAHDVIDVQSPLHVGRFSIRDFHPEKTPLNVAEVLIVSSNKGSARIADRIGAERQQDYFEKLGFFKPMPLEIREAAAPLVPAHWGRAEIMTMSYGHGISITPMHLINAMATTIGNGTIMTPSLIKKTAPDADIRPRLFSPETITQIRAMMRRVVSHPRGTANFADAKGYLVAGKTGTSEKIKSKGYNRKANITSFIASFPAHDPKYAVFIMVDEPKGQKHSFNFSTAGWVAAPVGGRVIQRIAPMLGVHPVDENAPKIRQTLKLKLPELDKVEPSHASF